MKTSLPVIHVTALHHSFFFTIIFTWKKWTIHPFTYNMRNLHEMIIYCIICPNDIRRALRVLRNKLSKGNTHYYFFPGKADTDHLYKLCLLSEEQKSCSSSISTHFGDLVSCGKEKEIHCIKLNLNPQWKHI